jgi:hypothetical protein
MRNFLKNYLCKISEPSTSFVIKSDISGDLCKMGLHAAIHEEGHHWRLEKALHCQERFDRVLKEKELDEELLKHYLCELDGELLKNYLCEV